MGEFEGQYILIGDLASLCTGQACRWLMLSLAFDTLRQRPIEYGDVHKIMLTSLLQGTAKKRAAPEQPVMFQEGIQKCHSRSSKRPKY